MSASSFVGPFSKRGRRERTRETPRAEAPPRNEGEVYRRHDTSQWVGGIGEQVRLRVRVEHAQQTANHTVTLLARVETSGDLVEWNTPRRHRICVGDRLALSGLVKAHTTRHDTRVTVLRDCFNPLRMT